MVPPAVNDRTLRASWLGTAAFVVVATAAAISGERALEQIAVVFDVAMFVAGCVTFICAYAIAARRSRTEEIDVVGLYLLGGGSAPRGVRRRLFGALAMQVAVGLATATARRYSALAFGILAPMYGFGLAGLWSALHGTFPPRRATKHKKRSRA